MKIKNPFVLIFASVLSAGILGCQNLGGIGDDKEKVSFVLPEWNAEEESGKCSYPQLLEWKICVRSADFEDDFVLPQDERNFSFTVNKNEPFCVTATPVTTLSDGTKSCFFKPAGVVYPYSARCSFYSASVECPLTWEEGFSAFSMQKIINSKKETGISEQALKSFLMSFNWKKLQEKIEKNIFDSIQSFEQDDEDASPKFYNPWQIDSLTLLDNLSFAIFEAKYLNTTYILSVQKQTAKIPLSAECLSSFILENQIIKKYGIITLKKKVPQTFIINNTYAVTLTATSAKKVSATITYMPIHIEETDNYEHSE